MTPNTQERLEAEERDALECALRCRKLGLHGLAREAETRAFKARTKLIATHDTPAPSGARQED